MNWWILAAGQVTQGLKGFHPTHISDQQSPVSASSTGAGLVMWWVMSCGQTDTGESCALGCPLLEVPLIVFQTDVDALSEVAWLRNGLQEVGLDQRDVIELRGAGCARLSATWVQEHLRNTHTEQKGAGRGSQVSFVDHVCQKTIDGNIPA